MWLHRNYLSILFVGLYFTTFAANAYQVIGIADGDTLTLLVDDKPLKIRLANIDAPEKKQPYGRKSKESLSELCWGKEATFKRQTIDRYKRTVALVTCGDIGVNREQVRRGMAWVYTKYNDDPFYEAIQEEARVQERGLWKTGDAVPPWKFRQQKRSQHKRL